MAKNPFGFINADFKKLIKRVTSRKNLKILGKEAQSILYKRVKNGFGVNSDSLPVDQTKKDRLKALSPSYIKQRQGKILFWTDNQGRIRVREARRGETFDVPAFGEFGSVRKSNLTFTGQMLDALSFKIVGKEIELYIKNTRRKDDPISNSKLADIVAKERPFFALTKAEYRILERAIKEIVNSEIRKIFK